MSDEHTDQAPDTTSDGFAELGLRPELLASLAGSATRSRRRSSARRSRRCSRVATCSARRPPAPARPRRSRCPILQRLDGSATKPVPAARWSSCPPASWPCRCPRRSTATGASSAPGSCRSTAASRSAASSQALDGGVARRRRHARPGARPHRPRHAAARRRAHRRARRGRRDARHGLRRGHRGDPRRDARRSRQTVLFSATMPPRIDAIATPAPARPGAHPDRRAGRRPAETRRWCARPPTSSPRAHKPAALGPHPRRRGADGGDRVLPHPRRGRPAHRDAERPRLPRRGAARRHEPGAARPGHGPAAQRAPPSCWSPPTSPPAASTSTQLTHVVNYDVPVGARGVRPPHRPRRPGRPRGRRDHARRAPRAAAAQATSSG